MHYLDHAATTQPGPAALAAAVQVMENLWGNPSSFYQFGLQAEDVLQKARGQIARALGSPLPRPGAPGEIFFTSGGTEANNLALLGAARARKNRGNHIITTGYEHPSVLAPLEYLAQAEGFRLTVVAPKADGRVDPAEIVAQMGPDTILIAAMQVNNETGAVLDVVHLAEQIKAKNPLTFFHVDGIQGFCKLPLALAASKIDSYALSGHKIHAPKGVGALYLRGGRKGKSPVLPLVHGGSQEEGLRPGTENTALIAALGAAAQEAFTALPVTTKRLNELHHYLLDKLSTLESVKIHSPQGGFCGITMFSMGRGLRSQVMLNMLDSQFNVQVSSGSACSAGSPSHTLTAMGVAPAEIDSALRVSFGSGSTTGDVDALVAGLTACQARLARR